MSEIFPKTVPTTNVDQKTEDIKNLTLLMEAFFRKNLSSLIHDFAFRLVAEGKIDGKRFDHILDDFDDFSTEYMDWQKVLLEIDRLKRIHGPQMLVDIPLFSSP
jgi:hypothetical protein